MFIDRRQFEREIIDIPGRYEAKGKWQECHIDDISEDGVGLEGVQKLHVNEIIKVEFRGKTFEAKVVYTEGTHAGVKLINTTESDKQWLVEQKNIK
ncbi:PilZ domain-containing protein [Thermospira aquatica]|uniref:PilZ domain-containing protein n=1 Tax=Thermospira aquatica TaxID=2828656 RepID=A0AAX3BAT8_9SPIR|nr:PilZ domain-containing protein [Thermospira aquatica]URA09340.1 PilZ domain-containing protein [Thermospira aquatica]